MLSINFKSLFPKVLHSKKTPLISDVQESNYQVGIMFNSLPKSASEYCWHTLANNLNYEKIDVSGGIWPEKIAVRSALEKTYKNEVVSHDHLFPNHFNLLAMNRYLGKWIIHIRDPRQATISWVYHLQRRFKEEPYESKYFKLDDEYFSLPFEKQLDIQIEQHYPLLITWINQWLDIIQEKDYKNKILLTTFENFLEDKLSFFKKILDFHNIEHKDEFILELPQDGKLQYRKGEINEWQYTCTQQQKNKLATLIDSRIESFFHRS